MMIKKSYLPLNQTSIPRCLEQPCENVYQYTRGKRLIHGIKYRKNNHNIWNTPAEYPSWEYRPHYTDVIMGAVASQITCLTMVYSTVYPGADQRKHQSSASLAFVRGIHRGPGTSPHKWPVTRKMFPFDDVITWYLWVPWRGAVMFYLLLDYTSCYTNSQAHVTPLRCDFAHAFRALSMLPRLWQNIVEYDTCYAFRNTFVFVTLRFSMLQTIFIQFDAVIGLYNSK